MPKINVSTLAGHQRTGLLGWLSCTLNGSLRLEGLTLRKTLEDGRLTISYPAARRDAMGRQHFYVRPLGDQARRDLEFQILQALGLEETAAR